MSVRSHRDDLPIGQGCVPAFAAVVLFLLACIVVAALWCWL